MHSFVPKHYITSKLNMKAQLAFSGFYGHCPMSSDFGAICRVVWIFGNIRRFNPHAGVVLKEYDDDSIGFIWKNVLCLRSFIYITVFLCSIVGLVRTSVNLAVRTVALITFG